MASPYKQPSAPLPPPPPVYRYRRSLAGPLILILIGVLFLLRNVGVHIPVWHFFGRFWPGFSALHVLLPVMYPALLRTIVNTVVPAPV